MHILIQNKRRPYKILESHSSHSDSMFELSVESQRQIKVVGGTYLVLGPISLHLLSLGKFRGIFWEPHGLHVVVNLLVNTLVGAFVQRSGTLSQSLILLARVVLTVGRLELAPEHLVLVRHLLWAFLLQRKISAVILALGSRAWILLLWVLLGALVGSQFDVKVLVHQFDRVSHGHVLLRVAIYSSPLNHLPLQVRLGVGAGATWHATCFVGGGGLGAGVAHFFDYGSAFGFPGVSTEGRHLLVDWGLFEGDWGFFLIVWVWGVVVLGVGDGDGHSLVFGVVCHLRQLTNSFWYFDNSRKNQR